MPRRTKLYAAYGMLLFGALAVAASNPLLFQKLNTLRPGGPVPDLDTSRGYVDIDALIRPIPLAGHDVWSVHPATRHRLTMVEGGGNCSQMSFGLAYQLNDDGTDYQIIHMITQTGVAIGDGHTVIRIPYRHDGVERVGLVDVSFASILTGVDGPLDVADLEALPIEGWGHVPLNDAARFPNYHDDFLVYSLVGYIPPREVVEYYAFLDRVYFRFGTDMLEKYVFDGLALVFGRLPEIFVPQFERLLEPWRVEIALHRTALWLMRSALAVVPLVALVELAAWRRRARASRFTAGVGGGPAR